MTKIIARTASALLSLGALSASAAAHIVLDNDRAEAGGYYTGAFRIGHGCDGSATTTLKVTMPEGLVTVRPQPKPGWTVTIEKAKLPTPIKGEGGRQITERVASITWAGRLDPDYFDEFGISTKLPAEAGTLYFPAVQTCEAGSIAWTDIPAAGQAWHDVPHPAPVLVVAAGHEGHGGHGDHASAAATIGSLSLQSPWIRAAAGGNGAAYVTIANGGGEADQLVAVGGDVAGAIEIHDMTMQGEVMQMRKLDALDVPAGGTAELSPGGAHIMLIGLKGPLRDGQSVTLSLSFAKAGKVDVVFPVRAAAGGEHDHH